MTIRHAKYAHGPAEGLTESKIGTFPQVLYDEDKSSGWNVTGIKNDWKRVFPFDNELEFGRLSKESPGLTHKRSVARLDT